MRLRGVAGLALACATSLAACSSGPTVTADELATVVERDGVAFEGAGVPAPVVERLAANGVVLLGETHHLREHWDFTVDLLRELHGSGFRQLLVEQPQMADWWLDEWVTGGEIVPEAPLPPNWRRKLSALRDFNDSLPPTERIHVRAIDANEDFYGGAASFQSLFGALTGLLGTTGPAEEFGRSDYSTPEAQSAAIDALAADLRAQEPNLSATWGPEWFSRVTEMVDVEAASIPVRVERRSDDDNAARAREEIIKELADARIAEHPQGTVINIGGNHAQKSRLKGTDQEWLGDYLVHKSPEVDSGVVVVSFTSARTDLLPGAGGDPVDVLSSSPEGELFRLIAETWPGTTVFLPLDDPLFSTERVPVSYEETVYNTSLAEHYDAVLQYGLAHRMPAD
jgi:hypothetical protein